MPSLKEYNVKINSLKNTAKVTKTMKMVSTSKFRKAQDAQNNSRLYAGQLKGVISRLASSASDITHPLMKVREVKKVLVVICSSDKGLCAGFNSNLFKFVTKWVKANGGKYESLDFISTSKRSTSATKHWKGQLLLKYEDKSGSPDFAMAKEIGELAQQKFIAGDYDEIFLAYSRFESALLQKPTLEKILPISSVGQEKSTDNADYIYEPNQQDLLSYMLPKTVNFSVFSALLESAAGEHAARMTAMDNATTNAKKIINEYTIRRNRARQAQITTELTEIVAGAESLK